MQVRPVDEDDGPPSPPTARQKTAPRVQVIVEQSPPAAQQQRQATKTYSQPPQAPQAQQISPRPTTQQANKNVNVEGEARVRYNFKAETPRELPCSKVGSLALFICSIIHSFTFLFSFRF